MQLTDEQRAKAEKQLTKRKDSTPSGLLKRNFERMIQRVRTADFDFFTRINNHFNKQLKKTLLLFVGMFKIKKPQPPIPHPKALDDNTRLKELKSDLSQFFQNLLNDFDDITFTVATKEQKEVLKKVVAKRETNLNSINEVKRPKTISNKHYAHEAIKKVIEKKYVEQDIKRWDTLYGKEERPLVTAMDLCMQIERLEAERALKNTGMSSEDIKTTLVELDQNHSQKLGTSFLNSEEKEELKQNMNKTNIAKPTPLK
jgi:hypothetical protein